MQENIFRELIPFLPEIALSVVAIFSLILGLYGQISKAIWWIAGIFVFIISIYVNQNPILLTPYVVLGGLYNGPIAIWLKSILLCFTLLLLIFYGGMNRVKIFKHGRHEFVVIVLLATVGSMIAISARNFLFLYIAFELVSLSSYILAAYDRELKFSTEAGMKYFILGSLSSCLMVFGMSYIYGYSGSLMYSKVAHLLSNNLHSVGLIAGLFLFITGIFFKLSIAPFHFWTPDIYQGSPFISVAFFTSIPKFASIAGMLNIINHVIGNIRPMWEDAFIFLAVASMLVGALGAIVQKSFKRLMGYSTILNMGFILLALSLDTTKGFSAAIIYQILYSIASLGLFATLSITIVPDAEDYEIKTLEGFGFVKKLAAFSISIFMFSLVGIPPLAGFFAKFYIIESALEYGLYKTSVIALLITVISAFYYINIVRVMYFALPSEKQIRLHESSALVFIISICVVITMLFPIVQHYI